MLYVITLVAGLLIGAVVGSVLGATQGVDDHCAACAKLAHLCQCTGGPR